LRPQQVVIELTNRLDRLLEFLVIGQPAPNLGDALATDADLPRPSTRIRHRQNEHLVAFAARALRTAALMTNNAFQQRAAQQFARDRKPFHKLVACRKGSISNHSQE
jgi:hypothetical protein